MSPCSNMLMKQSLFLGLRTYRVYWKLYVCCNFLTIFFQECFHGMQKLDKKNLLSIQMIQSKKRRTLYSGIYLKIHKQTEKITGISPTIKTGSFVSLWFSGIITRSDCISFWFRACSRSLSRSIFYMNMRNRKTEN